MATRKKPSSLPDIQKSRDSRGIPIDQVGITNLQYPIQVMDRDGNPLPTVATISMSVHLPHHFKGTHMSRFLEILTQHEGEITMRTLPVILHDLKQRLDAKSAHIEVSFPYFIEKAGGAKPRFLSSWDAGFRAYAVLFTNRKFARENPEALRAFMRAYVKGWRDYLEGDPTAAHAAMKLTNSSIDDTFALASRQLILDEKLVTGRDADGGLANIGQLSTRRFATQITQLEEIGLLAKGKVTPAQAMTTEFLPPSK